MSLRAVKNIQNVKYNVCGLWKLFLFTISYAGQLLSGHQASSQIFMGKRKKKVPTYSLQIWTMLCNLQFILIIYMHRKLLIQCYCVVVVVSRFSRRPSFVWHIYPQCWKASTPCSRQQCPSAQKCMYKAVLVLCLMSWIWKKNAATDQLLLRLRDWEMFQAR